MSNLRSYQKVLKAAPEKFGPALSALLRDWRKDQIFSCVAFAKILKDSVGAPEDSSLQNTLETSLRLADEKSGNGYHNHHHNREVTALTLALLARHKNLNLNPVIHTDMIWLTLTAAAIHDYKHDGTSNKAKDAVYPMRLERLALESVKDPLKRTGLSETNWLKLSMMILPTDITETCLPSPSSQLKDIFRYNSGAQKDFGTIDPLFMPLLHDPELTACSEILSDADLGVSAGLDRDMADLNSAGLATETQNAIPQTPQSLRYFLNQVCAGFPGSPAGKTLLTPGYSKIQVSIQNDLDALLKPGPAYTEGLEL